MPLQHPDVAAPGAVDSFDVATALRRTDGRAFAWDVPDGWQQGRGAWGGLVVGALARAVTESEPDTGRVLRSVTVQIPAPALVGPHSIAVHELRRSSSMATWRADVADDEGRFIATMTAVMAAPRSVGRAVEPASWNLLRAPAHPDFADTTRLRLAPPAGPAFSQHIDAHPTHGHPGEGGEARTAGWVGYAHPVPYDQVSLLALVDAWWPATLPALMTIRPMATVSFSASLLLDPATLAAGAPLFHEGLVAAAADGFTSEHRRLWTADGRLAVDNQQSLVLIA